MPALLLDAKNLTKRYGRFEALKGVSFSAPAGACFGLLGPNGAGKSTTLRLITAFLRPTSGELRVLGMDPVRQSRELKARLGVVHQEDNLDEDLSVIGNLMVFASYFRIPPATARERAADLLNFTQLREKENEKIRHLSGGMRRRLMIARGLINNPELLVLDEPTTGLDPQARHLIWDRLLSLKARGVSLVLCTHYMEEAARMCDDLILMHEGRIVARGAPAGLIREAAGERAVELPAVRKPELDALLLQYGQNGVRVEPSFNSLHLFFREAEHPIYGLLRERFEADGVFRRPNLEDVFLLLTGRDLVE